MEAWQMGIADVRESIADGALSVVGSLESVLERLEGTEARTRAWAHVDREAAEASARDIDSAIRRTGVIPPLAGAVIGVKDVIDVGGMPTVAGSVSRQGSAAVQRDASIVSALRDAGAIILGKTETYEFAFGQGHPPTLNPRDPARYAGGSSIGSGVAVAVGSAHAALGTDTGGSVRNPASVNGLVGLKPTAGLLDLEGLHTLSDTLDQIGPIARTVRDCELLLSSMLTGSARGLRRRTVGPGLADVRIAVDRRAWQEWNVSEAVVEQTEQALRAMESRGAVIVDVHIPEWSVALSSSLAIALAEAYTHHATALRSQPDGYLPGTRVMLETGAFISRAELDVAHRARSLVTKALAATMDSAQAVALAAPTLPAIPPLLADMDLALTSETSEDGLASALQMLTAANLTGMPALSVPSGTIDGHPIGLHLTGRHFCEPDLFAVAAEYEHTADMAATAAVLHP